MRAGQHLLGPGCSTCEPPVILTLPMRALTSVAPHFGNCSLQQGEHPALQLHSGRLTASYGLAPAGAALKATEALVMVGGAR